MKLLHWSPEIMGDRRCYGGTGCLAGVHLVWLVAGLVGWLATRTVSAQAVDLFFADFETGVGPEWSTTKTDVTPVGNRRFLGQFGNETVSLTFSNLPPHQEISVSFDLFVIQTWDGNELDDGPDIWDLTVGGGPTLLHTTFNNHEGINSIQAFPGDFPGSVYPARTGVAEINSLGYPYAYPYNNGDSVYPLVFTFPHADNAVTFEFSAQGLQELWDESWGVDNVTVDIRVLPLFSEFTLNQLDLQFSGIGGRNDSYHLAGRFVLGQDSDGMDLLAEDSLITVGPSTITLPAGTLSKQGTAYGWQGNMGGAQMAVLFDDRGTGAFGFDIQAAGIDLRGVCNPVMVQLLVGNDLGKASNWFAGPLHLGQPADTTPPQITVATKPIMLWPPDHGYRRIKVSDFVLSVTDADDKDISVNDLVITQVTSNEPDDAAGSGDGKTVNDIVIGNTGQWVDLRAEREGRGNGRVYTIQVSATNASGNVGTASCQAQVPHDKGGWSVKDAVVSTVTRDVAPVPRALAGSGSSSISAATITPVPALAGELQLDAKGMFIRWQSAKGQAYRVEYKETLTDPDWVPLGIDILGTGDVMAVRVPTTVHPQRFYRLRVVE